MSQLTSRFFHSDDPKEDKFILPLPPSWWSRPYEYTWAGAFAASDDIVLDAACGVEHPFKFFLLDHARFVQACDMEDAILKKDLILKSIQKEFGNDSASLIEKGQYIERIQFRKSSITKLPYEDAMFDKIFCISVLEHLKDRFNQHPWLPYAFPLKSILTADIFDALSEFKRVLKNDGLIVLTFDYPDINLQYFQKVIQSIGLAFAGDSNFDLPANALYSEALKLNCFRAALKKSAP